MGEKRNLYRVLVGKPDGKRPIGRPRCKWENIKNFSETGWSGVDWVHLAQERDQWMQ
jgi:hypothetical protein